ncbi:hypothetical protein L1987_84573 [Smallanthus sonchifolius]|uniref:Uncharacterized protein n=1 Tax=Smallanthus sonchifolius TaxID=185202 RepID=A0ACB8YJB3_9ASTR|nr:hypothetical protein L1987_84573 [Smallanthus sonchifolius]
MGNGGLTWILLLNVYLFCRGLMECHRRGKCMRSEACLTQTSTGFGWGSQKFNPSKLTVPRIHDLSPVLDDPDTMEEMGEEDVPDFNITNAQKQAICNSLMKYGAVKADDQANWELGEWEFFQFQVKQLNIDPDTCVEDVDSDSNETAQFFKSQMQHGAP